MKFTVLTVDDALTMRKMIAFTLKGIGCDVVEAADGVEGLRVLNTHRVDLIITDVNMPRMDGLEFTRQARSYLRGRPLPILILTTETEADKKSQGRAAGATGWLVKPFQQEQLVAVVRKVLPGMLAA